MEKKRYVRAEQKLINIAVDSVLFTNSSSLSGAPICSTQGLGCPTQGIGCPLRMYAGPIARVTMTITFSLVWGRSCSELTILRLPLFADRFFRERIEADQE